MPLCPRTVLGASVCALRRVLGASVPPQGAECSVPPNTLMGASVPLDTVLGALGGGPLVPALCLK